MGLRKPKALESKLREEKHSVPKGWIRADFAPESLDKETNEIDVIWSVGKKGLRSSWDGAYYEELSMDPQHVQMGRLSSGNTPFADNHELAYNGNRAVLGRVINGSLDAGIGKGRVKLMDPVQLQNVDAADTIRKIQNGILVNISVGYNVYTYERQPDVEGDDFPTYLATDWEPTEISIVPVGFDESAVVRNKPDTAGEPVIFINKQISEARNEPETKEVSMTPEELKAQQDKIDQDRKAAEKAAGDAARSAEKVRIGEIRSVFSKLGLPVEMADKAINEDKSIDEARSIAIDEKARVQPEVHNAAPVITGGTGNQSAERNVAIENAIQYRANPRENKLTENGRMFANLRMMEIARSILESSGLRTGGLAPMMLVERAFNTTSDFSNILANVANKSLRAGYEQSPRTFTAWAKQAIIPDFKQVSRTQLGEAPVLEVVGEGGEIKRGTMVDGAEKYQLLTYAKIMAISRQAIINDDLNAFTDIPRKFGFSAASLESDLVYGIITANAALSNGNALFSSGNSNNQGTGVALGVDPVGELRKFIRLQKGLDGKRPLNLMGKYLLVPAAIEQKALQITTQITPAQTTQVNPWVNMLMPVVEPRLDGTSSTAYYLICDPAQCDTVEYGYLEGQEGVYTESRMGFDVDGLEIKARLDFGTKALDFRGMARNVGA